MQFGPHIIDKLGNISGSDVVFAVKCKNYNL